MHTDLLIGDVFIHDTYVNVDWLGLLGLAAGLLVALAVVCVSVSLYRNRRRKK